MSLTASCPRCREVLDRALVGAECPEHGAVAYLWRPTEVTYDDFAEHLRASQGFPTYLPWPMGPGWSVTDFGVVASTFENPTATLTCVSGTSQLDGPVDAIVVAEEPGTGLGARVAGLPRDDPGADLGEGRPAVKVRIGSQTVPLWAVTTSHADHEFDRSVFCGEAHGRWLWMVLRPASAMLLLRDDWILRDVSEIGPPLLEMPFGGPRPTW